MRQWKDFMNSESLIIEKKTKKGKVKEVDVRSFVIDCVQENDNTLVISLNWREDYMSPLKLLQTVNPDMDPVYVSMTKIRQVFA
jgi:hypothetical protein